MPNFKLGERWIGDVHPPLVIAEIGINHGGDLDLAISMADAAIDAGAEVVKHQTHIVEDEMSDAARTVIPGNADRSIYEIMDEVALSEDEERKLMEHVERRGAIFLSTPFSRAAADRLAGFGVRAYKIGSGECSNYPLIKHVAQFGCPIILSTGMHTLEAVRAAVEILRSAQVPFALLHCTNVYPTPPSLVRLPAMQQLRDAFPDAVIGLSDHTTGNYTCFGAVALGASVLERHFTDTMNRPGPDIPCSMDPLALRELIDGAHAIFSAMNGVKGPVDAEAKTIDFAVATVVAIREIDEGERLTEENIWLRRPNTGDFAGRDYERLLSRGLARRHIQSGTHLKVEDVTWA